MVGTSVENPKSTRELTAGIAKDTIAPLNKQAELEIDRLAHDPDANFTVEELSDMIDGKIQEIGTA